MRPAFMIVCVAAAAGAAAFLLRLSERGSGAVVAQPGLAAAAEWPGDEGAAATPAGERSWTRQAAARLGRGSVVATNEELWQLAHQAHPMVAGNAVRALGRRAAIHADARIEALLADPRVRVRQEAVLALGRSRDPAAVDRLGQLLAAGDTELRPLVLRALGELGGGSARALVMAVLADPVRSGTDVAFGRAALRSIDAQVGAGAQPAR